MESLPSREFERHLEAACGYVQLGMPADAWEELENIEPEERHFLPVIEMRGAMYHSSKSARDRDRLRQEVLERRGWKIHRIWSTDWFRQNQAAKDRLLAVLRGLA